MPEPKKKKKTMVTLPGSLKNLVHNVQNNEPKPTAATDNGVGEIAAPAAAAAPAQSLQSSLNAQSPQSLQSSPNAQNPQSSPNSLNAQNPQSSPNSLNAQSPQTAQSPLTAQTPQLAQSPQPETASPAAPASPARTVTVDHGDDAWGLFLDLAAEYKQKDSQLATIYIDRDLKNVLDRLRSSRSVKMPTTAILSAIVARFIFENEQRIKDAIYGAPLI